MTTQKIFNLNVKSNYSLLQSCLSIDKIINHALKNKWNHVALIDVNNMYGALDFYHKAINNNLKPIIGIDVSINDKQYLLVALNYDGYLELVKISSNILTNKSFELENCKLDNCAIIGIGFVPSLNHKNIYTSLNNSSQSIAIKDSRFENDVNSYVSYRVLQTIDNGNEFNLENVKSEFNIFNSLATDDDLQFMSYYQNTNAFDNLNKLIGSINWEMPINQNHMVEFQLPNRINHFDFLKNKCLEFLNQYFLKNKNINKKSYLARLNYELNVINDKNFIDYFLVVADFIEHARKNKILIGPGRGSVAGSLVAFCLEITKVDPIKYNLIFERFLNPNRTNMPDIDTDVMDKARDIVVDYLFKKYGNQNVGLITTFQTFKAKMAIRDVGKLFGIDSKLIDVVAKSFDLTADESIIDFANQNQKIKQNYLAYPDWFNVANSLLNAPRQISTHAAGVILSNTNLDNVCPITIGLNQHIASQYSWNFLEEIGLIKMDILGLKNLSIIDSILKIVKLSENVNIDLDNIPFDDEKTYQLLSKGKTNGVFQLESPGMKKLVSQVKPKSIEDIAMINALFRPGPLNHINEFIEVRNKTRKPTYLNSALESILKNTYGIILYQEQVIELVSLVAKFDPAKADIFRKAISKKDESKMTNLKQEFITGAINNGYNLEDANTIYNYIFDFANYGFNHSHAIAYSIISYWMAYLKSHYPVAFFVALLTDGDNTKEKILSYVNEAKEMNIKFLGPDINLSNNYFSIIKNGIVFSLSSINGIGNETSNKIISIRNQQPNQKFSDSYQAIALLINNGINKKVITTLIKIGAFDSLGVNRNTLLFNLDEILNKYIFINKKENKPYFDINIINQDDITNNQKAEIEAELLGISLTNIDNTNLFQKYRGEFNLLNIDDINNAPNNVLATLNNVTIKVSQKTKRNFANVSWTINNKFITTIVFSSTLIEELKTLKEKENYIIAISKNEKNNMFDLKKIINKIG